MRVHYSISPREIFGSAFSHRELVLELVKQDFIGRYKGSILGVAWSLLHPLFMLAVYTVVFSVAFKARWGLGDESKVSFAIVLFAGLIVHGLFAECLNRAPGLIVSRPSYVKKVVFPLEVLPLVSVFSALLHFLVSLAILMIFCVLTHVPLHATALLVPLVMLPLFLMALGLSWLFASLGVYLRDMSQIMGFVTTALLFISPVFYKAASLPESYQIFLALNPLTLPIEQLRDVMLWGKGIDWANWTISLLEGVVVCYIGFYWFQKSRKGFADVL